MALPPKTTKLTPKQDAFLRIFAAGGVSKSEAYRRGFGNHRLKTEEASKRACLLMKAPHIVARLAELRGRSEAKSLLSLNDRLGKLAAAAEFEPKTAADRNALARVIEVYNKTAGDGAPDRVETTVRGDPVSPVVVTTRDLTKAEKIAALAASRRTRE